MSESRDARLMFSAYLSKYNSEELCPFQRSEAAVRRYGEILNNHDSENVSDHVVMDRLPEADLFSMT